MRPDDNYAACSPGCGCDNDQDLENSGSNFMPDEPTKD